MSSNYIELYKLLFDPVFLARFGYYDITIKNKKALTSEGNRYGQPDSFYFKVFNMECFSEYLKNNDLKKYFNIGNPRKNKSTEPIYFSIPKSHTSRRQYKMPNLYSYMALNYFICNHKDKFIDEFLENDFSTSKFFNQLDFDFNTTNEIKQTLLYGGNKILNIDLSNFYHTLYTHSIPWIICGKDNSKKDKYSGFANHLDKFISLCQYDETHGIPTGNLLSRIIAELYMCYFDKRMKEKKFYYSRYVDDFNFSFSLEVEKEDFLKELNLMCREYNLIINDNKTSILIFPHISSNNKSNIFNFFENMTSRNKVKKWVKEINIFIDYCIGEEAQGNKGSIKTIFSSLNNILGDRKKKFSKHKINEIFSYKNSITSFNIFEKILDVSLKDSRLSNRFLDFFENINKMGFSSSEASKIVKGYFINRKDVYKEKISYYAKNNLNQELYQILLYVVQFGVRGLLTQKILLSLINKNTDDFSLVLVTIIYLTNKKNIFELLNRVDNLFTKIHESYPDDNIRMTEKFWFFRYFFYYLIEKNILKKQDINSYCLEKGYKLNSTKGYETELNWEYIKSQGSGSKINCFYDELLKNKIWLVYCGENEDFKYLNRNI